MTSEKINNITPIVSDEISLKELIFKFRDWWRYLLSKWLIILIFGTIGGTLGFAYACFTKPTFIATTTFVLEDGNSGSNSLGNLGGLASMIGIDVGGGGGIFSGDNILELYKSRTMIEKALLTKIESRYGDKNELLLERYISFNNLREKWSKKSNLKNIDFNHPKSFTRLQDSILGTVVNDINKNYLSVGKPDKKLSLIRVDVKAKDEIFAKVFAEKIVNSVNQFYVDTKTKRSTANINILQHATDSVRAVMNGAIYTAAVVTDATPNLNPTRQVQRIAPIQRSQFSAETNKSVLGELLKNLEVSKMTLLKETPLIQIVDQPVLPLETNKFGKVKGILLGSILAGFIIISVLIIKLFIKNIMA